MARLWLGVWGALLVFGVIGLGIVVPLLLYWRSRHAGGLGHAGAAAAVLVLVGGFLLRIVVIFSSELV
jgi:formate-dependent nitrite reductase membrane component NrfD